MGNLLCGTGTKEEREQAKFYKWWSITDINEQHNKEVDTKKHKGIKTVEQDNDTVISTSISTNNGKKEPKKEDKETDTTKHQGTKTEEQPNEIVVSTNEGKKEPKKEDKETDTTKHQGTKTEEQPNETVVSTNEGKKEPKKEDNETDTTKHQGAKTDVQQIATVEPKKVHWGEVEVHHLETVQNEKPIETKVEHLIPLGELSISKKKSKAEQADNYLNGFRLDKLKAEVVFRRSKNNGVASDSGLDPEVIFLVKTIVMETRNIYWDDVACLEISKQALKEVLIMPLEFPHLHGFTRERQLYQSILLFGPPGTGKFYLAKAVVKKDVVKKASFLASFSVTMSMLVSPLLGESEQLVKALFELAREKNPAIIFIDDVDPLCSSEVIESNVNRRIKTELKTELLEQMQDWGYKNEGIYVLGATSAPWLLDSAMKNIFKKRILILCQILSLL